jgi:hypothetical protein
VTRTIEPKEVGWAGACQIARVDRRIGAAGKLTSTWLIGSRPPQELSPKQWLDYEQTRWGIETRNHYPLDVSHREDESRVRQPTAATVLGIFRRIGNAFKQVWAVGRPKRKATARDWIEEHHFDRWQAIRLVTRPVQPPSPPRKSASQPRPAGRK